MMAKVKILLWSIAISLPSGCANVEYEDSAGSRFSPNTTGGSQSTVNNTNTPIVIDNPPLAVTPLAPSSVVAEVLSDDMVILRIQDESTDEQEFEIVRMKLSVVQETFIVAAQVGVGIFIFEETDPLAVGTYRYKVRSKNTVGNSAYEESNSISIVFDPDKQL